MLYIRKFRHSKCEIIFFSLIILLILFTLNCHIPVRKYIIAQTQKICNLCFVQLMYPHILALSCLMKNKEDSKYSDISEYHFRNCSPHEMSVVNRQQKEKRTIKSELQRPTIRNFTFDSQKINTHLSYRVCLENIYKKVSNYINIL